MSGDALAAEHGETEESLKTKKNLALGGRAFHLSTLVIMTLTAGIMLGINFRSSAEDWYAGWVTWGTNFSYGWPFNAYEVTVFTLTSGREPKPNPGTWHWLNLGLNVAAGLGISMALGVCWEWWLRRPSGSVRTHDDGRKMNP